jgi:DNA-binding CsgD family transcriptional regulator
LDGAPGRITALLGEGDTVLVRGPAGIGKSTLVHRALRSHRYVVGQSLDQLRDLPYHPLAHAFGRPFEGQSNDVAADVAATLGDDTLVIEDAHWSDHGTLEVVGQLAGRISLVVTSRESLAIEHGGGVTTVDVPPLSPAAATQLARKLHPSLDLDSRSRLVELAGGNPLLLEQLVSGDAVSPTLRHAVRSRVAALPSLTVEQLATVALHGRPVPRDVLVDAGAGEVLHAGAALVREHADGVTLAHALLADAVVDLVDDDTKQAIHMRLARVCADADAARHLLAAGQYAAAADVAERAAVGAPPAVAAQLLALAVEARGPEAPVRLRLDAAAALLAVNQPVQADAIAAGVDHHAPAAHRAEAGWCRAQAAWLRRDETEAERHCDDALALVQGSGAPIETRLLIERVNQRVRVRLGDPSVIDDALDAWNAAVRAGVDRSKARSLVGLALSHNGRTGWAEHFEAAAALAREDGDVEQELTAMYWLVSAYGFYGPISSSIDLGRSMIAATEQHGLRRLHHHFLGAYLVQAFGTGIATDRDVSEARRLLAEDPLFRNRSQVDLALAIGLIDRADPAGAADVLAAGRRFTRNDEERSVLCVGQAELAWARGDRVLLRDALDELTACSRGFFGLNAFAESAAIHTLLHDDAPTQIPVFQTSLMPIVDVVHAERAGYESWRAGDGGAAVTAFAEAAATWSQRSFPRFAARCALAAGELARRHGDTDVARRHLCTAADMATRFQMAPTLAMTRAALSALERDHHRARLSPREVEVLELVAAGRTASQIAGALGVGESTVVTHVNSARTKLGARTRMQAATMITGRAP